MGLALSIEQCAQCLLLVGTTTGDFWVSGWVGGEGGGCPPHD